MAEIATIARPYAEALFKAAGGDGAALKQQLAALATLASDAQLRQFADNPKVSAAQVAGVVAELLAGQGAALSPRAANLLQVVLDNGRFAALPEISAQFAALVNAQGGISDALVESAYALDEAQLAEVVAALEKRFGRRLQASVQLRPELIGGIRVTVGDEVLDTSVKARLEQMKVALTA
jgi:F-type H+-transporting ATPase subunit delta